MLTFLFVLSTGLGTGAALGVRWQRMYMCSPTCQAHGVWLWTPAQEEAAWERGVSVGHAYGLGVLAAGDTLHRVRTLIRGRRRRVTETDDEPVPMAA
jgi:hypothetical protein